MKIDVEIEAARKLENAGDLRLGIGVGIGAAADQVGALLASRDQKLVGAGIVGQALLRKDADLQVDGPGIIALERAHGVKAVEADAGIDLHMGAHSRRAMYDRLLQRPLRARMDVGLRERALSAR